MLHYYKNVVSWKVLRSYMCFAGIIRSSVAKCTQNRWAQRSTERSLAGRRPIFSLVSKYWTGKTFFRAFSFIKLCINLLLAKLVRGHTGKNSGHRSFLYGVCCARFVESKRRTRTALAPACERAHVWVTGASASGDAARATRSRGFTSTGRRLAFG